MTEGMVSMDDIIAHRDGIGKKYFRVPMKTLIWKRNYLFHHLLRLREIGGMFALET